MYLSPAAYAEKWSISVATVYRAIRSGRLEAYKIGRLVRIDADALIEDVEETKPIPQVSMKQRLRSVLG